jgi:hypothetical protein
MTSMQGDVHDVDGPYIGCIFGPESTKQMTSRSDPCACTAPRNPTMRAESGKTSKWLESASGVRGRLMVLCLRFRRGSLLGSSTGLAQTETTVTCNVYVTLQASCMGPKLEFIAEGDLRTVAIWLQVTHPWLDLAMLDDRVTIGTDRRTPCYRFVVPRSCRRPPTLSDTDIDCATRIMIGRRQTCLLLAAKCWI